MKVNPIETKELFEHGKDKAAGKQPAGYAYKISGSGLHAMEITTIAKVDGRKYTEDRDIMTYISDDITMSITDFIENGLTQKSVSAQQLFHIMMIEFTRTKSQQIELTLSQYMEYRGLKDEKTAREQFKRDLNLWYRLDVTFIEKKKRNKPLPFERMRIIEAEPNLKYGKAVIVFTSLFYSYLMYISDQIEQFPLCLLKLSAQHDKYAYIMGTYLSYLERVQAGEPNQYRLKVCTILESCNFPTIEEMSRHADRIITAFIKAANKLIEIGYLHKYELWDGKKRLDSSQIMTDNYDWFCDLYFEYATTAPGQEHLINARNAQKAHARELKDKAEIKAMRDKKKSKSL